MSIFNHQSYRGYLKAHISALPKGGRGELTKISEHLGVNSTLISQIFSGSRDFNLEQGLSLSKYLGHTEIETEYFLALIEVERAGTQDLKKFFQTKIKKLSAEALKLANRLNPERTLTDEQKSVFYSSWLYSAVHIFSSLPGGGKSIEEVSEKFNISKLKANEVFKFLVQIGMCVESSGKYSVGTMNTFIGQGSPHLVKHHSNWRVRAIAKSEMLTEEEMMLSGQFSISKKDFLILREKITQFIKEATAVVKVTKPEELACLNIDWFLI